jgi:glucokinase
VELNPTVHCLAIDIGGTSTKLAIVSREGAILRRSSVPTPKGTSARTIVDVLVEAVHQLVNLSPGFNGIMGIGIGHPGFYDVEGNLRDLCNIPALNGFNLRAHFRREFQVPVTSDTDVSCGTLGEFYYGGSRNVRRFLFLTLGTGVGVGAVIDGKLVRTTRHCLGDPGHIMVDPSGSPCACGGKGCLEAVASGWAISRQAEQLALSSRDTLLREIQARKHSLSPEDVFQAASQGDGPAKEIVSQVGKWLAMGLASFSVILEPEVIVLGGGIAAGAGEQLLEPVRAHFFQIASPPFVRNVKLISARAGPDAGLLGAATLAFSRSSEFRLEQT